jgi:phage baseplate assembly protein W
MDLLLKINYYHIYHIKGIMANGKFINIDYPFKDSTNGFFIKLNDNEQRAIKADLMHLLLTRKGQRLYNPDFGTDILRYIFEPNDALTWESVQDEVKNSVKKYLPKLNITNLSVTQSEESEYAATIRLEYTITDNVFDIADSVTINV